jgi:plasmid stabilization system protein ParE
MTFQVVVEAEARHDWDAGAGWYEERESGVGLRFNSVVRTFLQALVQNPERFPLVGRFVRKAKVLGWPYSVYFTINTEAREVVVIAIWHGSRNPAELRRRLK